MLSSILSSIELANLSNDMDTVFYSLSQNRHITVFKSPIKIPNNSPVVNNIFGFGGQQSDILYSYQPVSGVFPAIIIYDKKPSNPLSAEINARVLAEPVMIKVKQDCRDFIQNGHTEHILADGNTFLIDGEEKRQMLLNTTYYLYNLREIL